MWTRPVTSLNGNRLIQGRAHRWIRPLNSETDFPSGQVREGLRDILGPPGEEWSFRVLNGAVARALGRLAESTDASLLIVGGQRPGRLAAMGRMLEGSVSADLACLQSRPVLVIPHRGA